MHAYMDLRVKPMEVGEDQKKVENKPWKLVSLFHRMAKRSVNYYQDETIQRMGSPMIWTE